jgi:transcriptional regulator with XRE-family HTH domain
MTISVRRPENGQKTDNYFAEIITSARKTAGYTLEQVAITSGLTAAEISAIESGKDIEDGKIRRLALALKIPRENLA